MCFKGGVLKVTKEIIERLEGCLWVEKITDKQISYTSKFKIEAVEQFLRGISANSIFEGAGLPVDLFPNTYAAHCLKRWAKLYKDHGLEALKHDKRGTIKSVTRGRPKENKDKLTYEELEAVVKIQSEIIETLKKRRALAQKK